MTVKPTEKSSVLGAGGVALLATEVRHVTDLFLGGFHCSPTGQRGWCYAVKYEAIHELANSKLHIVHSHILKTLEDTMVTDEEYKLNLHDVENEERNPAQVCRGD